MVRVGRGMVDTVCGESDVERVYSSKSSAKDFFLLSATPILF